MDFSDSEMVKVMFKTLILETILFLSSREKVMWICFGKIHGESRIYLRKSKRNIDNKLATCLDIGSIDVEEKHRGKGIWNKFILTLINLGLEDFEYIFVENVMEERFKKWFVKNNWEISKLDCNYDDMPQSFYIKINNIHEEK